MYIQYQAAGYSITEDPRFQNKEFSIDEALSLVLNKLFMECQQKNNKKIIPRLKALILKYPSNPQLKNFLSVAYVSNGEYIKSSEITNQILALHPNYLFGKINLAYKYISGGMAVEIPGILGAAMELKRFIQTGTYFISRKSPAFTKWRFAIILLWETSMPPKKSLQFYKPAHLGIMTPKPQKK